MERGYMMDEVFFLGISDQAAKTQELGPCYKN